MYFEDHRKRTGDIQYGDATVCAGWKDMQFGWFLPGMEFTVHKHRAVFVAQRMNYEMRRKRK